MVEVINAACSAHDYDDPGKPAIAWNDEAARAQLVDALVGDAFAVLHGLGEQSEPGAADALGLPALIAGQDVELIDEGSDPPRWQIAQQVAADRVISVADPEARHAHKTVHRRQDGFKAHLAVEPDTGLITDCALTKASGPGSGDAAVGLSLLAGEPVPVEVLADSAYGSGHTRADLHGQVPVQGSPGGCLASSMRRCRASRSTSSGRAGSGTPSISWPLWRTVATIVSSGSCVSNSTNSRSAT